MVRNRRTTPANSASRPMTTNHLSRYTEDSLNLRRLPQVLSAVFMFATLYQFGGIESVTFGWLDYTIQASHTVYLSLFTYTLAFASSETRQFENYHSLEQALIFLGPVVIILHHATQLLHDHVQPHLGDPWFGVVLTVVVLVGWVVAIK